MEQERFPALFIFIMPVIQNSTEFYYLIISITILHTLFKKQQNKATTVPPI